MGTLILLALITGGWNISVDAGLNLTQSYYNDAWQGDETGAITWTAITNMSFSKLLSEKFEFSDVAQLAYGQTYSQNSETKKWNPPQKSTDKIENEGVLKFTMGWLVDPFVSLRLESQFMDDANDLYVNPMTFTEAFGLARTILKREKAEMNSRLGLAFKETFDRAEGAENLTEGGLELVIDGKKVLSKIAKYEGKLRIFKALYNSKADELPNDNWKAVDFDFQNTVSMSLSKYIQLNLLLELVYDKDLVDIVQVKENFAIGLSYKLF